MIDDDVLMLINAWWGPLEFTVPATRRGRIWEREIDTFEPLAGAGGTSVSEVDSLTPW